MYAGLVIDVANFPNRVVIVLDDGTARIEVSCNHERFQRFKDIIKLSVLSSLKAKYMKEKALNVQWAV